MRKFLGVCGVALVLSLAAAPAALAQEPIARDPFLPLIVPDSGTGTVDPANPADPTIPVDPIPDPVDPLPNTGSSTSSWFGVGYFLVALGGGAVVLSKVLGPVPVHVRRSA
jgi:LPXTG-motif cell wall-anchored protein